jgi:hypothetical protein
MVSYVSKKERRKKLRDIHAVGARIEVKNTIRDPTVASTKNREHRLVIIA